ncbi:SAM hydrolase/SAM-dependent halogenase family protein [Thiovibrio frasassiensis]|uniref:SAM-dependent chlorinase/fluorinase n=1 Tax=Thiovibrio frasassiensis TaxID=2984131 RepID=A0A9X4MNE4_9BACT|nr:SAM-dependent chlorinase/fluorinase [Thiovibrio frasassiensis]MDG4475862.1 SAM-dependent chlorinase/fluorinase [Thiovibrio frasassiensis]
MPPIITVTTDFGLQDEYVGVMKGILAAQAPQAQRIDLCHTIAPQDIAQGAFLLQAAAPYFPHGTIHLAVVDPGVGTARELLIVRAMDHYFLAPDNGLLTPFLGESLFQHAIFIDCPHLYRRPLSATFHGRDILAPVAAALANGADLSRLGRQALKENLIKLASPTLQIDRIHGNIAGSVIHIDHFGNLTTNIHQGVLADLKADPASIQIFHKNQQVTGLTSAYASRPDNRVLALIGSRGYLELAVSKGNAAKILEGKVGDPVRVTLSQGA